MAARNVKERLKEVAERLGKPWNSFEVCEELDKQDELSLYRERFFIPKKSLGNSSSTASATEDCIYLCGNSLGLQPKHTQELVQEELDAWATRGVEGHFHGKRPWLTIDEVVQKQMAKIVGALPMEVAIMNSLTTNLHLLMISFYQPTQSRNKIVIEDHSFPSDLYAVQSQIRLHGYDPDECLIKLRPEQGNFNFSTGDILSLIEEEGDKIATLLLPGVQYYTGQVFDMKAITEAAHKKGCMVGFDLAHAVGNCILQLHDWNVDFAAWCTYKYLNSGPGCIGGAFVHERHALRTDMPQLAGWWGHDLNTRFEMDETTFQPIAGAFRYRLSNPPVLPVVQLLGSLEIFDEVGMERLRTKAVLLTGYLEELLLDKLNGRVSILTPKAVESRGCQLSIQIKVAESVEMQHKLTKQISDKLISEGIVCDVRKPAVIRVAPTPLYNKFQDVFSFVEVLGKVVQAF